MPQATKTKKRSSSSQSNGGKAVKSRAKTSASRSRSSSRTKNVSLVEKAKTPAIAAGAMLVGVAGGAAAMRNGKRRKSRIPRPKVSLSAPSLPKSHGSTAKWVGEKAQSLGDAGHRVAAMTDQAAKVEKSLRK